MSHELSPFQVRVNNVCIAYSGNDSESEKRCPNEVKWRLRENPTLGVNASLFVIAQCEGMTIHLFRSFLMIHVVIWNLLDQLKPTKRGASNSRVPSCGWARRRPLTRRQKSGARKRALRWLSFGPKKNGSRLVVTGGMEFLYIAFA